jgi:hypothetical protein
MPVQLAAVYSTHRQHRNANDLRLNQIELSVLSCVSAFALCGVADENHRFSDDSKSKHTLDKND